MGVEAQGDWANLLGSNVSLLAPTLTNRTTTNALGLFTGQVALAWQNLLWYTKGGVAVTNDKYGGLVTGTNILNDQASGARWGGTIGTGLEIGFAPNWSVGVEYDHFFISNRSISFTSVNAALAPVGSLTRIDNVRQEFDMATVRLNYRFGGPVVAKY
jgi:outer membrane immunogenic protein